MKKTTAVSTLLLLGGLGSLGLWAARTLKFNLYIDSLDEDLSEYCC
ncbi:hypothetical protein [Hymenobacter latericus]|nr:hypothetical protein [Hymenobacter sp. YIM 151858-1]UYZ60335.1 hypothetical protein OIS50_05930 [Hymenobacter sp. YIM 151858-1]